MASIKTNRLMTGPRIIPRGDLVSYHVCRSQSLLPLKTCVTQDDHVDNVTVTQHALRVTPPTFLLNTEIVYCNLHIIPSSSIFFIIIIFISFASNSIFNSKSNSKSNSTRTRTRVQTRRFGIPV